jgi:hypothetical protein
MPTNSFANGVVIFFRTVLADGTLARSVHTNGRSIQLTGDSDYTIADQDGEVIGIYPQGWVACILPLQITGPAGATN